VSNGLTVINNVLASPIFKKGVQLHARKHEPGDDAVRRRFSARQFLVEREDSYGLSRSSRNSDRIAGADDNGIGIAGLGYGESFWQRGGGH